MKIECVGLLLYKNNMLIHNWLNLCCQVSENFCPCVAIIRVRISRMKVAIKNETFAFWDKFF